ncbi:conserved hypothetical protein [Perkinsus marinus ATCC 50983]|uniref:C2HC/C3H-type domain-containing protein n=1 Tax=Perkinsus marinus (strain ATCC 50983 / TXsc) TaxID=423536 RepID=C5KY37_PERM5|nr:conserved hypothetical protein [Perkinsus marinus ATCC 50983]EER10644.1 conserved hypothetical protein [Perkinsus marinus ATCC 50983]|eukprot:XP_002778849.1 conserved hypothetical protein [Perkinsus marinus ATCC 50983]
MSATIPVNNVPRLEERHGGSNTMGGPQYGNTRRHSAQPRYSDDSPKEWYRQLSGRASASPESLGRGLVRRQRHSSGDTGPSTSEYGERVNRRTTETKDSPLVVDRKKSMPRIEKGVVVIGEVGVGEYPEEQMRMVKCQQCGRSFNEESIGKHEGVCRKVFKEKRREFDIVANRLHGFENKDQLIRKAMQEKRRGPQKAKPTKWKQQSEAFRAAIASCRSTDPYERQVAAAKFAELQAEHERQHMVKCPHCGRTFHDEASKRHIPICQKTFATGGGRLLKMIILGRQFRAIRSIIAVGISPTQGEPLATVESLLREVLRLDESMSDVDLLSIRDMFDDSNSLEREKYEECLGAVFEMLRLEKAYLSKMRECCEEHALPKPKHWIRMHEIIDGVEGDIQWKENQLLGTGSRGQFCARIICPFARMLTTLSAFGRCGAADLFWEACVKTLIAIEA